MPELSSTGCQAADGGVRGRERVIPARWFLFLWGVPVPQCHACDTMFSTALSLGALGCSRATLEMASGVSWESRQAAEPSEWPLLLLETLSPAASHRFASNVQCLPLQLCLQGLDPLPLSPGHLSFSILSPLLSHFDFFFSLCSHPLQAPACIQI